MNDISVKEINNYLNFTLYFILTISYGKHTMLFEKISLM
jgi:hypothetical protein